MMMIIISIYMYILGSIWIHYDKLSTEGPDNFCQTCTYTKYTHLSSHIGSMPLKNGRFRSGR